MAHHFLEKNNETLTVQKMREQLREVGIEKIKLVPLIHYLIFKYKGISICDTIGKVVKIFFVQRIGITLSTLLRVIKKKFRRHSDCSMKYRQLWRPPERGKMKPARRRLPPRQLPQRPNAPPKKPREPQLRLALPNRNSKPLLRLLRYFDDFLFFFFG